MSTLLERLDRALDAFPRRAGAVAEEHGPLVLFVRRGPGWPWYARPRLGGGPVAAADVEAVRARQHALAQGEAFEWVADTAPTLADAAAATGLVVRLLPLLVLDGPPALPPLPPGVTLSAGAALDDVLDAQAVAFGAAGDAQTAHEAVASGHLRPVAAIGAGGVLSAGMAQAAEGCAELVGIATRPEARGRGLAGAVVADLARRAQADGLLPFLSAGADASARVYERVGFRRVGTAGMAAPPSSTSRTS